LPLTLPGSRRFLWCTCRCEPCCIRKSRSASASGRHSTTDGRAKITASCTLNVEDGMVILANSERVRGLRRNLAELPVAQAPNSQAVQDIAVRCGVTGVRYPFRTDTCVLCGRCVRVCTEVWRSRAIGFVGPGKNRHIDFPFGVRPEFCKQCENCRQFCPMTVTPCDGPIKHGEERLSGQVRIAVVDQCRGTRRLRVVQARRRLRLRTLRRNPRHLTPHGPFERRPA
jgi:ferredoxin